MAKKETIDACNNMISIVALYVKIYLVEFLFEKFSVALKTYFHLFAKKLGNREIFLILNFLGNEFRSKMNSLRLSTVARIFNHLRYVNWRSNFSLSLFFRINGFRNWFFRIPITHRRWCFPPEESMDADRFFFSPFRGN